MIPLDFMSTGKVHINPDSEGFPDYCILNSSIETAVWNNYDKLFNQAGFFRGVLHETVRTSVGYNFIAVINSVVIAYLILDQVLIT